MNRPAFIRWGNRSLALLASVTLGSSIAHAQRLGGTITAEGSGAVAAVVVSLVDASGKALARTITDRTGKFLMPVPPGARSVQIRRIGFRPQDLVVPDSARTGPATITVVLRVLPQVLDPVHVLGASCPGGTNTPAALAYWEQAQAGFLSSIVTRDAAPAEATLLSYQRTIDPRRNEPVLMNNVTARVLESTRPFLSRQPDELAKEGYRTSTREGTSWYGPDPDVLLDPLFRSTHCFTIEPANNARRDQIGIAFMPATGRERLIDIQGVLWLTRAPLQLRELEFRYTGVTRDQREYAAGGRLSFKTMENGIIIIDDWLIRSVEGSSGSLVNTLRISEVGGALHSSTWKDGTTFKHPFSSVTGRVTEADSRQPIVNALVFLNNTPYQESTNTDGSFRIGDVIPGPYNVVVADTSLAPFGVSRTGRVRVEVTARGGDARVALEPAMVFARDNCGGHRGGMMAQGIGLLATRVVDSAGAVVKGPVQIHAITSKTSRDKELHDTTGTSRYTICGLEAGEITVRASTQEAFGLISLKVSGKVLDTATIVIRRP